MFGTILEMEDTILGLSIPPNANEFDSSALTCLDTLAIFFSTLPLSFVLEVTNIGDTVCHDSVSIRKISPINPALVIL
tara:strand:- start:158 stop:391 length:234 start_codon:yes stop_codon:yes gene_type:complete